MAALALFSAAVPAYAQSSEAAGGNERDLPAVVSAVSLEEAVNLGLLDDGDAAAQTAASPALPAASDASAETPREETDLDAMQAQVKAQFDKFMALFQTAKKESEQKAQEAIEKAASPAYYDADGVRLTRNMAYVALAAEANKKLPELTGGDLQAAIAAVKTKAVQEKLDLSTDGRLNALVVSGEASDAAGNLTKVSIDRNLALPVVSYDILHGTVRDGKGDESFILSLTGEKIPSERFTQTEIHGFKAFTADTGKSFYVSLFMSPYLTIRAETAGENAKERAVAFFDNIDYTQLARAMKTLNVKETTQEVRAYMDKTMETPDGRHRIAEFYDISPAAQ